MRPAPLFVLFMMLIFCASAKGQTKAILPTDSGKSEAKGIISPYGPTTSVRTIRQDNQGSIWLATNEGVIRYDGKTFTNVTDKVSSDRFFSVLQDRNENFWFGNFGSGVYYYDGKSLQNFTTRDGLISNRITSVYEDKAGNIWFGAGGGVSRYDGKSFRNYIMDRNTVIEDSTGKSYPNLSGGSNGVNPVFQDKKGRLWFGTNGNTFLYDGKQFAVVSDKDDRIFTNVWSIIEDKKGNIWLGGDGVWCYDGYRFINFSDNTIRFLCEDKAGNIWGSGVINGRWALFRFDGRPLSDKKPAVIEIPESLNLFGLFEAKDGAIWFGSFDGVYRYDGNTISDFKNRNLQK